MIVLTILVVVTCLVLVLMNKYALKTINSYKTMIYKKEQKSIINMILDNEKIKDFNIMIIKRSDYIYKPKFNRILRNKNDLISYIRDENIMFYTAENIIKLICGDDIFVPYILNIDKDLNKYDNAKWIPSHINELIEIYYGEECQSEIKKYERNQKLNRLISRY